MQIRSPEHITKKEISYFSSLYDDFEQALLSPDGTNAKGKSYMDYIDVDSFVDAAVLNEFTLERDGGAASWYFYLPEGSGKFYAGPAWDFDVCMESVDAAPDSVYLAAKQLVESEEEFEEEKKEWRGNVLLHLLSKREFVDLVARRSTELCGVFKSRLNARTEKMFEEIASSAACDRLCWGYEITNEYDIRLRGFIPKRAKTLKSIFSDFDAAAQAEAGRMRTGEAPVQTVKAQSAVPVILTAVFVGAATATVICVLIKKRSRGGKKQIVTSGRKNKS